ncbi:MAG: S41 family peptidase [Chitinophagaceae bacterium]|nr:S41 family peptidase [Chitinophagaceae bacterium]MCW5905903.1 S41 family peptidase [Chitinophagaceae bacterium]
MIKEKKQVWLPILFALVMVFGMVVGFNLKKHSSTETFLGTGNTTTVQEVLSLIRNKYVEPIKMDSISEITINELLSHLDPHSLYIPPINVEDINDELLGNFQGIGIEFQLLNDTVNVINVIPNGPSEKAGILIGDKLIAVNDSIKIAGVQITTDKIRHYFRGKAESKVSVTLLRNNQLKNITITRGVIPISTIDAAYLIEPQTGFIKLNKFGDKTYEEFMAQLEKLQKQGMKNLIVDLRGNTGGLMNEAVDIADEFLSDNKLVVYTEGDKSSRYEYKTKRDGLFEEGNLIILVDEKSASASEILAGTLQDWDRATIVGRRTFGKGLVQQQFPLSNGGALRLTIARYYTPLGRNIQKPYNHKSIEEYRRDALNGNEIIDTDDDDSTHKNHTFTTPKGKIVYGGGGILPDIVVTEDSVSLSKKMVSLYQTNVLRNAALQFYVSNKTALNNYTTPTQFYNEYKTPNNLWQLIEKLALQKSIAINTATPAERTYILTDMQKLLAKFMFGDNGYYEIANKTDKMVIKCLEIVNNK